MELKPKYEFPIHGVAWTKGAGHPAGLYFLDGRCHIAAQSSPAEELLVRNGALRMGSLRFDRDPFEAGHPGREIGPVRPDEALRRFGRPGRN